MALSGGRSGAVCRVLCTPAAHLPIPSLDPNSSLPVPSSPSASQDLGVDTSPRLQTLQVEEPAKRKAGVVLGSPAELVDRLRNEAKVI